MQTIFRLIRAGNLVIVLTTQVMTYLFLRPDFPDAALIDLSFGLFLSGTLCIAAAGYVINDYFDVKIDAINRPDRLVIGELISPRMAIAVHILLNAIGIALAFWLSTYLGLMFVGIALLLWHYSAALKRTFLAGNLSIALLLALTLLSVYVFDPSLLLGWVLFYTWFAFLTGLIREIVKDVEDMEGDEAFGCNTLPLVKGFQTTRRVLLGLTIVLLFSLAVTLGGFVWQGAWVATLYFALLLVLPTLFFLLKLLEADRKRDFTQLSLFIKAIMVTGIVSMVL